MFDKRLLALVRDARALIALNVVLQWFGLLATIALFFLIGTYVQDIFEGKAQLSISFMLGVTLAVIVRMLCNMCAQNAGLKAGQRAQCTIRQAVYDKLVQLGPAYRERVSTSEAVQVGIEGAGQLENYFGSYLPQLFYALCAPLTLFVCLAPFSLWPALVMLVCVPLIPLSLMVVQKRARRTMRRYWGSYTNLGALFLENIQGLTTLKIFQADEQAHVNMNKQANNFREATMRLLRMQLNSINLMDLCAFGGAAAGIVMVLIQFVSGSLSFGVAFALIMLSAEFFLPLRALGSLFHIAMGGMAVAEKIFRILETPTTPWGTKEIKTERLGILCENVSYSFDGKRRVLSGVDVEVPAGSFIGIAGVSGSGKSTLAGVISATNLAYDGRVCLGGQDLRSLSQSSLRRAVSLVSFNSYLFKGSIRKNLLLAKPDASDEQMWEALRRCRLDAFARRAGGLDAKVAEAGENLSGGQRQRLAMARALLSDASVYVLDEATSNIDSVSENAIIELVHELAHTKTVIMISHRLSALCGTDSIYVLDEGRVVQHARHDELVKTPGLYAQMWEKQADLEAYETSRSSEVQAEIEEIDPGKAPLSEPQQADSNLRQSRWCIMRRLVKLTGSLVPVMMLAIALGVLGFLAAIAMSVLATEALLEAGDLNQSFGVVVAMVALCVCAVVRGPLRYGEQLSNHYLAFRILALVRDRVFGALRRLTPAKLQGHDKGDLVALITSDVELLEVFYAHTLSPVAIAFVVSLIMVVFIGMQSPLLALVAFISYILVGVAVPLLAFYRGGKEGRVVRDQTGALNSFVLESLRGLSQTLQFGGAEDRSVQLEQHMVAMTKVELHIKGRGAFFTALIGALVTVCNVAMLLVVGHLASRGVIDAGAGIRAIVALMASFGPVIAVANLGTTLQQTLASADRVLELLDEKPQTPDVENGCTPVAFSGANACNVNFSYATTPVLREVSLDIKPGQIIRIAGKSGAGKSSLLKLFMRFWDVDSGKVEVSTSDIRSINTTALRELEGFMTQDTYLFAQTVRENIMLVRPDANLQDLTRALQKAALCEVIDRLPKGLDTRLGEMGDTLSGGERQRIGLARLFLHDAPFLLLDEPTSNLDSLNEAQVLKVLTEHRNGKTIIIVSHRASVASIADLSYSVERGSAT